MTKKLISTIIAITFLIESAGAGYARDLSNTSCLRPPCTGALEGNNGPQRSSSDGVILSGYFEWYPDRHYVRSFQDKLSALGVANYFYYLKKIGCVNINGLKMVVKDQQLFIYAIPRRGDKPQLLHKFALNKKGQLIRNSKYHSDQIGLLLRVMEEQGIPRFLGIYSGPGVVVGECKYMLNKYLTKAARSEDDIRVTKQVFKNGKIRLQIREKTKGIEIGNVIEEIDIDADGRPAGLKLKGKKTSASFWYALIAQDRLKSPEIMIWRPGASSVTFGDVRYGHLDDFVVYLAKKGTKGVAGLRFEKRKGELKIIALVKAGKGSQEEISIGILSLDKDGYPLGVKINRSLRIKNIFPLVALFSQGYPEEKFFCEQLRQKNEKNYTSFIVYLPGQLTCLLNTYLRYKELDIHQLKFLLYMPTDKPHCLDIVKRAEKPGEEEAVLDTLYLDEDGWPEGLDRSARGVQLLELLRSQEHKDYSPRPKEFTIERGRASFSIGNILYSKLDTYFHFIEFIGYKGSKTLDIKECDDSIEIRLGTDHETSPGKLLHRIALGKDKKPVLSENLKKNYTNLLKVLLDQSQIDAETYRKFCINRGGGGQTRMYPTPESAQKELIDRLARFNNDEKCNTASFLNMRLAKDGGDSALYDACRRFGIPLPASARRNLKKYPTRESAEKELKARAGDDDAGMCNTAKRLKMPAAQGGDHKLLLACRRFKIPLPKEIPIRNTAAPKGKEETPFETYLAGINRAPVLTEEEARSLWKEAMSGDNESTERFILGMRPLIYTVLQEDLYNDIDAEGFVVEIIEHLTAHGDYVLATRWFEWSTKGSIIDFFRGMLAEELVKERKAYYAERNHYGEDRLERPVSFYRHGAEESSATLGDFIETDEMSPMDETALRTERSPFGEEELIRQRDEQSGLPFISTAEKKSIARALGELFNSHNIFDIFKNGSSEPWSVFTVGSLGRLGTAVKGSCDWNGVILTTLPNTYIYACLIKLRELFSGTLQNNGTDLPSLTIGKEGEYNRVMEQAENGDGNGNFLKKFVDTLGRYSIGSLNNGIATIEAVSVSPYDALGNIPQTPVVDKSHIRTLAHMGDEDFAFQAGTNAYLVAESEQGAAQKLIDQLTLKVMPRADFATVRLEIEDRFLQKQREHFDEAFYDARSSSAGTVVLDIKRGTERSVLAAA